MPAGLLLAACLALGGCTEKEPVRIGFIGGLSQTNADNGESGLQALMLAVEQFNRAGGIDGRPVELIARDDAQHAATAAQSARELVEARVEAVIGPFTSAMAVATVPVTARAGIFQISPTVTSMTFHGKDDNFFRINRTTRDNARDYAAFMMARGQRRFSVAYDTRNRNFTESWLKEFREAATRAGAVLVAEVPFESGADRDFAPLMQQMLKEDPDSLLFLASALDVARLTRQARRDAPHLPVAAAEWAATERLIEFGGQVAEGLLIVQNYDQEDGSVRYTEFRDAYFKRFRRLPDYSSVSTYDAATVVLTALRKRRPGETMKAAVLRNNPYLGLQQTIEFDANGDTLRKVYFTEIREGRYVQVR